MSLYRFGHTSIGFCTHTGQPGVTVFGGHGKIAPEIESATTQRIHAPLNAEISVQGDLIDIKPQYELQYAYEQPKEFLQRTKNAEPAATIHKHVPIPREHAVSYPISTVQLPPFLYLYVIPKLQQLTETTPSTQTPPTSSSPQFAVLYGGRQSPTSILNDLWIFNLALDFWVQVLPFDISILSPDHSQFDSLGHQCLLFSLPGDSTQPQSQHSHYLSVGNDIYSISLQPTQLENPIITIQHQLDFSSICSLIQRNPQSPPSQSLQQQALNQMTCQSNHKINQFVVAASTTAPLITPTLPLPRYKTAATVFESNLFIHGGRSGYAQHYVKPTTCFNFNTRQLIEDDAFNVEAVLPLTAKTVALRDDLPPQSPSQTELTPSQIPQHSTSQPSQPDPIYISLILNDLWMINFNNFPFQWSRLDTTLSASNQILPSHRFAHAAQIISLPSPPSSQSHQSSSILQQHLVLSGGLRLNNVCDGQEQNSTSSSYHKALIASPTLFFINITPFLNTPATDSNPCQLAQTAHHTPTLLLDKPHHTDKSDQIILPPFIQSGQRPYDIYGHQLLTLYYNTHLTLICIGGTSHTCLAGASVMAMDIKFSSDLYSSQTQQTSLYWTPIHAPIEHALFVRHTATILDPTAQTLTKRVDIAVLGGGALCFSFGSYYSPSMILSVSSVNNEGYSPHTALNTTVSSLPFSCLTPAPTQSGKKKQPQKAQRDNHTTIDISKNIAGVAQSCVVCGLEFESKNKLFKHISITGHRKVEPSAE